MAAKQQSTSLLGRIAVQMKMITMDQLRVATTEQARCGDKRIGEIFVELEFINEAQLQKLKQVQRDVVARHRAKQAVDEGRSGPVPAPAAPAEEPAQEAPQERSLPPAGPPARELPSAAPVAIPQPEPTPQPARASEGASPAEVETPLASTLGAESQPSSPLPTAARPAATPEAPAPASMRVAVPVPAAPPQPVPSPQAVPPSATKKDGNEGDSLELTLPEPTDADLERLHGILRAAVSAGASDIHIHSNSPFKLRINGELTVPDPTPLSREEAEGMVAAALTPEQRAVIRDTGELDICYTVPGIGRFRTNLYRQHRGFDVVMRSIPPEPPTLESLRLPSDLAKYTSYHQGMVLITGPAGCGKSSTLAALVNVINEERDEHILCIEDPIEVVHPSKRCLVNQRHAGSHTQSFARALRGALREDPDVIVIGELRDLETISLAMTAAETGHFVLATLHTNNAVRTINRMIGAFPSNEQGQVRTMLSESLRAVISQRLVPAADGSGRLPALELLVVNKAIGNLIRDEKTVQIRSAIQTGRAHGMYLLEQALNEMVKAGDITREEALKYAEDEKIITG